MFLVVVCCIGQPKIVNTAIHLESQGLTEKKKRELMKSSVPKKEFLSIQEDEEEILQKVQPEFEGNYVKLYMNTVMHFLRNCQSVDLQNKSLNIPSRQTLKHSPQIAPHIVWFCTAR